jgi:hypothetical protein
MNKTFFSFSYAAGTGCKKKHKAQDCIMEFGSFTKVPVMLVAMALSAC